VDSGSTFTYLSTKVHNAIWEKVEEFCGYDANCVGDPAWVFGEQRTCYKYSPDRFMTQQEFFDTFPLLVFKIDDVEVYWEPKDYLFAWSETPNDFCIGVYNNGGGGSVLGMNFMRGKDVILDRTNQRIGFAPANCDIVN
jgi:hypothetical protein